MLFSSFLTIFLLSLALLPLFDSLKISVKLDLLSEATRPTRSAVQSKSKLTEFPSISPPAPIAPSSFTSESDSGEVDEASADENSSEGELDMASADGAEANFIARPQAGNGQPPSEVIKSHRTKRDCWVLLRGAILDISRLDHPTKEGVGTIVTNKACGEEVASTLVLKHTDETLANMKKFELDPKTLQFILPQSQNPASLDSKKFVGRLVDKKRAQIDKKRALKAAIDRANKDPAKLMALLKKVDAGDLNFA